MKFSTKFYLNNPTFGGLIDMLHAAGELVELMAQPNKFNYYFKQSSVCETDRKDRSGGMPDFARIIQNGT